MKTCAQFSATIFGVLITMPTIAYELATHAAITAKAINRMQQYNPEWLTRIGLNGSENNPFGNIYYDVQGANIKERSIDSFAT